MYEFKSQVKMDPSKPDVTRRQSRLLYSMFFTQLECPRNVLILVLRFLVSYSATVESSEHVAKSRSSRNLRRKNAINLPSQNSVNASGSLT